MPPVPRFLARSLAGAFLLGLGAISNLPAQEAPRPGLLEGMRKKLHRLAVPAAKVQAVADLLSHRRPPVFTEGELLPDPQDLDPWEREAAMRLLRVFCLVEKARAEGLAADSLLALAAEKVCGRDEAAAHRLGLQLFVAYEAGVNFGVLQGAKAGAFCEGGPLVARSGKYTGQILGIGRIASRPRLQRAGWSEDLGNFRLVPKSLAIFTEDTGISTAWQQLIRPVVASAPPPPAREATVPAVVDLPSKGAKPDPTAPSVVIGAATPPSKQGPYVSRQTVKTPSPRGGFEVRQIHPDAEPFQGGRHPGYDIILSRMGEPIRTSPTTTIAVLSIQPEFVEVEVTRFGSVRSCQARQGGNSNRRRMPRKPEQIDNLERKAYHLHANFYLVDELLGGDSIRVVVR